MFLNRLVLSVSNPEEPPRNTAHATLSDKISKKPRPAGHPAPKNRRGGEYKHLAGFFAGGTLRGKGGGKADAKGFPEEAAQKSWRNIWQSRENSLPLHRFWERGALSSAGSERLPYKQRVGGSNPSAPTTQHPLMPSFGPGEGLIILPARGTKNGSSHGNLRITTNFAKAAKPAHRETDIKKTRYLKSFISGA